jgi:hypothetical protein
MLLGESRRERFVVASSRDPHRTFALVVLQHVMPQLMQKDFFQNEPPKRVVWPMDKSCTDIGQPGHDRARPLQTPGHVTFQQPGQAPGWQWLFKEDDPARHAASAKHWHRVRCVGWRSRELNRAQPVQSDRADRLEHLQYVALVRRMMESWARFSHDNPKPPLVILLEFPSASFSPGCFPISSQLTSSAQIRDTTPFAWCAKPASRADGFGVRVFAPGHGSSPLTTWRCSSSESELRFCSALFSIKLGLQHWHVHNRLFDFNRESEL